MKIIRAKDYKDMSRKAANIISAQVIMKPNCVLGLATGGTPVGAYAQLVEWYNKGDIDFSEVTTVNLDEYRGLPKDHPESYWSFMHRNLFDHVNIDPAHINLPDGTNLDAEAECKRYDEVIRSVGGVDLQLLGIGHDGHIGFNEPHDAFDLGTHCVDLTQETIEANKRFFDGNVDLVPKQAYTMGIRTIMQARKVLLVVNILAVGIANTMNAQAATSRVLYGMSRDNVLPGVSGLFRKVHPRFQTPYIATIAVGIFSILVAELSTVEDLARLVNFGALTSFILLNLAVYNFFWRREKMRGGKALLNYVICPFCGVLILGYVWLSFDSMTQIVGFSWLAIGLVIGYVKSKGYKVVPEAFRKSDMV